MSRRVVRRFPVGVLVAAIVLAGWSVCAAPARAAVHPPATNYDPDNRSQNVYFEGSDGSLREISWTPSAGWDHISVIAPGGSLGSAPATNYDPDNRSQNEYFAGTDGSLREISWTPSAHWDAVSIITPSGTLGSQPSPPGGSAPSSPAGQGTVALTPAPAPARRHHRRRLAVRIVISWRWNGRHTRLVRVRLGRLPRRAVLSISCRGRGCPAHKVYATRHTLVRRHRSLPGRMYRAGDRLLLTLTAPSYAAERARIVIRNGRVPAVKLL